MTTTRRMMTHKERAAYIVRCHREGIGAEEQIRLYLPLLAGEVGNSYADEYHIRMARYTADVRFLLGVIDELRASRAHGPSVQEQGKAAPPLDCKGVPLGSRLGRVDIRVKP